MPNLDLTHKELEFLQRLIGHHFCGAGADRLYDKIAGLTESNGIHSESPLPLRQPYNNHYGKRLTFSLSTLEWSEQNAD